MTVKLSELRVTASLDASAYQRGAAAKAAADKQMLDAGQAVGRALAAQDAALDKSSKEAVKLSRSYIDGYAQAEKFERAIRNVGRALDTGMEPARARAAIEGIYRSFGRVADGAALAKQGFVSLTPLIDELNAKQASMGDAARRAAQVQAASTRAVAAQAGLARHEVINLSRQIQDVGVSLASGQSPFTVLVQQGSQIADVFATSRASIGDVFKSGVAWAGRFATSIAGVTTAIAGAAAGVGYLGASYSSSMRSTELALLGRGRASGMTAGDIAGLARDVGGKGPLSISEARGIATGFAGAGTIDRALIPDLTRAAHPLSLITGGKVEDAGKALTEAFMDPAKGAQTLGAQLGVTNAALLDYIRNAQAAGNLPDAQRALFNAISPRLEAARGKQGFWSRAWNSTGNWFSNAGERIGAGVASEPSFADDLRRVQAEIRAAEEILKANPRPGMAARLQIPDLRAEEAYLQENVRFGARRTTGAARDAYADITSEQGAAVIRGVVDDIGRLQALKSQKSVIDAVLGDPAKFAALAKDEQGAAKGASDRLGAMIGAFGTAASRAAQEGELQVRAIMAVTVADRAAVEADRARIEAIKATGDASLAAVQAENARARIIADANRQIADGLRDAQAQAKLIGLADGPRRLQELRNRQAQERLTLGGAALAAPPPSAATGVDATFRGKVESLIAAIGDAGARMTSGFRSFEKQAELFDRYGPGKAARPGSSQHERGTAMDFVFSSDEARQRALALGSAYGVRALPSNGGAVHFDMGRGGAAGGAIPTGVNDNMLARKQTIEAATLAAEMQSGPLVQSRQTLAGMNAQYEALRGSIGATEREQASLNEQARLYQEYARAGITVTPQMAAEIAKLGGGYGEAAERLRLFNFERKQADEWRSFEAEATKGLAHDVVASLRQGENGWKAFGNAAVNALNRIADKAIDSVFDRIFMMGGGGGGLFGGLFSGLFSGFGPASGAIFADGAAFSSGRVIPFANGDVLSRPTVFPMAGGNVGLMGEAGPEAIMPLGRGRDGKLGVRMAGGGGGLSVNNHITVNGDASAETIDALRAELRASEARMAAMMRGGLEASIADEPRRAAKREARAA